MGSEGDTACLSHVPGSDECNTTCLVAFRDDPYCAVGKRNLVGPGDGKIACLIAMVQAPHFIPPVLLLSAVTPCQLTRSDVLQASMAAPPLAPQSTCRQTLLCAVCSSTHRYCPLAKGEYL